MENKEEKETRERELDIEISALTLASETATKVLYLYNKSFTNNRTETEVRDVVSKWLINDADYLLAYIKIQYGCTTDHKAVDHAVIAINLYKDIRSIVL